MEILLAEDDRLCRQSLTAMLEGAGYAVRAAMDGAVALELFRARRPDLVLLDVMMPVMDGFAACRELRKLDAEMPVLFLTAKDAEADELAGRGLGADDYIPKTVSEAVLLARIATVLRRVRPQERMTAFAFGDWRVNPVQSNMVRAGRTPVDLSDREVALLRFFARHPGEIVSRDYLLTHFWDGKASTGEGAFSTALYELRQKLGADAACLESVWGRGVRYRAPAENP